MYTFVDDPLRACKCLFLLWWVRAYASLNHAERIKACAKIKGFWVNTMLNHPNLKNTVGQNDEECLMSLNEVDVQEIDDDEYQVCGGWLLVSSSTCRRMRAMVLWWHRH